MTSSQRRRTEKARRRARRLAARAASGAVSTTPRLWRGDGQTITVVIANDGKSDAMTFEADGDVFRREPTAEPGTFFECDNCDETVYVEGILPVSERVRDISTFRVSMLFGCRACGSDMTATQQFGVDVGPTTFMTTHPMMRATFLKVLLQSVESGELSPEEAVAAISAEMPELHPIVQWIEKRGATLAIVVSVLLFVLNYVDQRANDDSLTPEDIQRIVRIMEEDEAASAPPPPTPASQTSPTSSPDVPRGK